MQPTKTVNEINNQNLNEENNEDSEFERLLDEFTYKPPKRGQIKEGEIKYMDEDSMILDIGMKRDAVVYSSEINQLDDSYFEDLSIGDIIPISIQRTPIGDEDLVVSISDALVYQNWEEVKKAKEEGDIVALKVFGKNKGGLLVKFNLIEGFVPNSHISGVKKFQSRAQLSKEKEQLIGQTLQVTPIEVDRENQRLVFSARAAEESVQEERLEEIKEGEVLTGKVVNVVDFGAFIDLGGVDGLIHLSELSWKRVKHPSNVLDIGDEVEVLVMNVDTERNRIQLSRKALMQGPWDRIEENHVPGDLLEVKIVNVVDFGAFAQLPEGIHGLIHVSELGYTSAGDPLKTVEPGDEVLVKVLNIDRNRERISLSMRQVPLEAQYDWALEKEGEGKKTDEGEIKQEGIEDPVEVESSETQADVPVIQQDEAFEQEEREVGISNESAASVEDESEETEQVLGEVEEIEPERVKVNEEIEAASSGPTEKNTAEKDLSEEIPAEGEDSEEVESEAKVPGESIPLKDEGIENAPEEDEKLASSSGE